MSDDDALPRSYRREHDLPHRALIASRRTEAYALKMRGWSLEEIGLELHADPTVNTNGREYPAGYGWMLYNRGQPPTVGLRLQKLVSADLTKGLRRARLANEEVRQEALTLTLAKLETAASGLWDKVLAGNARAHEVWLANLDRQIALMGLEPASELHITVSEGPQPDFGQKDFGARLATAFAELGVMDATTTDEFLAAIEAPKDDDSIVDADVVGD